MSRQSWRDLTVLGGVVLLETIPFLHRAIHLDENTYLAIAANVPRNFWFPQDFPGHWFGIPLLNFSGHSHPTGLAYYLAMVEWLFHSNAEWLLRLSFVLFPLLFALSGYLLACRYTKRPLFATILMLATPALFVFSPTLMPDLPMTAFWLLAVICFESGLEDGRLGRIAASGLFLVLATMVSYQAIFMAGLLGVYAFVRGERRISVYAALALPFLFLSLYWYAGYRHFGFWQAERSTAYLSKASIFGLDYFRQKVLGMFSTLGATTIFFAPILWVFQKSRGWKSLFIVMAAALIACFFVPRDYLLHEYVEYVIFSVTGIAIVWQAAGTLFHAFRGLRKKESISSGLAFLSLWILGVIVYTIFLCEFSATRYFIAIIPPLVILFVRDADNLSFKSVYNRRVILSATLAMTWITGLGVAVADYKYVGSFREFSRWFASKYSDASGHVWVGTEAGLRYYMQAVGARTLTNGYGIKIPSITPDDEWTKAYFGTPQLNDLLVRPESFLRYGLNSELELAAVIDSKILNSQLPIRTWGPWYHAGLHGTNVGLLPYTFSTGAYDRIEVSQYNVFAAGFAKAKKVASPEHPITTGIFQIGELQRTVIVMPPQAELAYDVSVPPQSEFEGEAIMERSVPTLPECALQIQTIFREPGDKSEVTCSALDLDLNHSAQGSSPEMKYFNCDAGKYSGRDVAVTLRTVLKSGPVSTCPSVGLENLRFQSLAAGR